MFQAALGINVELGISNEEFRNILGLIMIKLYE